MEKKSVFSVLNNINVQDHVEVKDTGRVKLSYLSWAWAWAEVKKNYPSATYRIYENADGWNYHTDGRTCWVKTGVTIDGLEHIEYLPVMDFRNQSIAADKVTSFDVNKAIQRSLTKACARHGLGLYVYAGEDLPEEDKAQGKAEKSNTPKHTVSDDVLGDAALAVEATTTIAELQKVWMDASNDLQRDDRFKALVNKKKAELEK